MTSPIIDFRIECDDASRYWITLDGETIWDFPAQFAVEDGGATSESGAKTRDIPDIIREYIDTPDDMIYRKKFDDKWGLIDILRSADRRHGIAPISVSGKRDKGLAVRKIIEARLKASAGFSFGYESCVFIEYKLSFILGKKTNGYWCDGVIFDSMIDNNTVFCRAEIVNKEQTLWQKFNLILHLGRTSSSLWPRGVVLKECIPDADRLDTVYVDISQKTIHFYLD